MIPWTRRGTRWGAGRERTQGIPRRLPRMLPIFILTDDRPISEMVSRSREGSKTNTGQSCRSTSSPARANICAGMNSPNRGRDPLRGGCLTRPPLGLPADCDPHPEHDGDGESGRRSLRGLRHRPPSSPIAPRSPTGSVARTRRTRGRPWRPGRTSRSSNANLQVDDATGDL